MHPSGTSLQGCAFLYKPLPFKPVLKQLSGRYECAQEHEKEHRNDSSSDATFPFGGEAHNFD